MADEAKRANTIATIALLVSILSFGSPFIPRLFSVETDAQLAVVDSLPETTNGTGVRLILRNTGEEIGVISRVRVKVDSFWPIFEPECDDPVVRSSPPADFYIGSHTRSDQRVIAETVSPDDAKLFEITYRGSFPSNESGIALITVELEGTPRTPLVIGPYLHYLQEEPRSGSYLSKFGCASEEEIAAATEKNRFAAIEVLAEMQAGRGADTSTRVLVDFILSD